MTDPTRPVRDQIAEVPTRPLDYCGVEYGEAQDGECLCSRCCERSLAERDALRATVDRVRTQPQTPGCIGPDDNDSWKAYHSGWSTAMTVVSRALDGPESLDVDAVVDADPAARPAAIAAYLGVTVEGLHEAVDRADAIRALDGATQPALTDEETDR